MEPTTNTDGEWQPCPPGEVGHLVRRLKARESAVVVRRRMIAAVVLLMAAFTGYYFMGVLPGAEPNYGGIVCSAVQELAAEYRAGKLDAETADRIHAHLAECDQCQQWMGKSMPAALHRPGSKTSLLSHGLVDSRRNSTRDNRPALEGFVALNR